MYVVTTVWYGGSETQYHEEEFTSLHYALEYIKKGFKDKEYSPEYKIRYRTSS